MTEPKCYGCEHAGQIDYGEDGCSDSVHCWYAIATLASLADVPDVTEPYMDETSPSWCPLRKENNDGHSR